ncbi:MAG: SRPBCC family protein [Ilumatobacteraceae bacterium]
MARYVATIRTPRSAVEVFDFMADFRNVAEWDHSVRRIVQIDGDGAGAGAVFDVTISRPGRDLTLRYRTVEFDPPHGVRFVAKDRWITSDDLVTVTADGSGARVVYDARLVPNGPLRVVDPLLGPLFGRFAARAADGLRGALDGVSED